MIFVASLQDWVAHERKETANDGKYLKGIQGEQRDVRDGGAVKWEMVVIAWCASVNSAVISHTTCCCDLPGAPREAPSRLACACTLMRLPGRLIGFRAGDESALSPLSPLWRLSSRPEQTDSYLGLCCNSPLKWVLARIPSRHLGPQLTWENNLMMPPPPPSDKT